MQHKYYDIARRAHTGTSFDPETRAVSYCNDYDARIKEGREKAAELGGNPDEFEAGYTKRWLAWMGAKSRCISSMITGPSNFPLKRANKANASEQKRCAELIQYTENYFARLEKAKRRAERANVDPIAEMEGKLKEAKERQELMKAVNAICRKKISDDEKTQLVMELGVAEKLARAIITPGDRYPAGFQHFELTNNLARIKNMEHRLQMMQTKAAAPTTEVEREGGVRVVKNTDADRLQIFYPGKPDAETIGKLKKNAFKWSPTNGCWQRQLTSNAIASLKNLGL